MNILKKISIVILLFCFNILNVKAQNIPAWKISDLQNYIAKNDSVLVINFWATFCKPCVEELPYLQNISKQYKDQKVKLLLVSLDLKNDYPNEIDSFANKNNYTSKIVWLNETNADFFCPKVDKSWTGSIPSTYFINPRTGYKKFIESEMKPEEFEKELKKAL